MLIDNMLNMDDVSAEIAAGYVTERAHPEFPELRVLNYTDRCQYDQHWTPVTTQTRGLIYHAGTRDVVARGFAKWFNYGDETHGLNLSPNDECSAYIKWDGSLGIAYCRPDGRIAVATRGSFASDQAAHATARLAADPDMLDTVSKIMQVDATPVFEIIYPENRIVVDYGDRDELVYLGLVSNATGTYFPSVENKTQAQTIRDVIATKYEGQEGFIVQVPGGAVFKWKHEEYLALHRIVSHLTVKEVWRQLRAGTFDDFVVALPDEFHEWAKMTAAELENEAASIKFAVGAWWFELNDLNLPDRKSQALWVAANVPAEYRGFVFGTLDGKDIRDGIWRMVEPKGATTDGDLFREAA